MGFHHLAMATRDVIANHLFYQRVMGFELVKVEIGETPEGGWAKHFFYDQGDGEMMAFWELHDESLPREFPTGLSEAAGLPPWVNHIAFRAASPQELENRIRRWLEHGYDVLEIDHVWCRSIYTTDPNRTLVEWCLSTGEFDEADRSKALRALGESNPIVPRREPKIEFHKAALRPLHLRERSL